MLFNPLFDRMIQYRQTAELRLIFQQKMHGQQHKCHCDLYQRDPLNIPSSNQFLPLILKQQPKRTIDQCNNSEPK